jgi:spore germination protein KB
MIDKGKISANQMGKMVYLAITPTAILTAPGISFNFARQDIWLSPVWAICGLIAVPLALGLNRLQPDCSAVQACRNIFGRFPGWVVAGLLWLFFLYLGAIILREYGEFIVGAYLNETPLVIVLGSLVLVCALAVRGGVEIVGRFADLFLPSFLLLFLLIMLLIIPDLHITNMMPFLGDGLLPSLKGAVVLQIWFAELSLAWFLLPFVSDRDNAKKVLWITFGAIILTLLLSNWVTLLLLGELTGGYSFPFLILARYIDLAEFFTHLESLFMAVWVLGAFVKVSVFFHVMTIGAAEWMGLRDFRPIVFPMALLLTLFGIWVASSYQEMTHSIATSLIPYAFTMLILVPALLYIVGRIRGIGRGAGGSGGPGGTGDSGGSGGPVGASGPAARPSSGIRRFRK